MNLKSHARKYGGKSNLCFFFLLDTDGTGRGTSFCLSMFFLNSYFLANISVVSIAPQLAKIIFYVNFQVRHE